MPEFRSKPPVGSRSQPVVHLSSGKRPVLTENADRPALSCRSATQPSSVIHTLRAQTCKAQSRKAYASGSTEGETVSPACQQSSSL